MKGRPHLLIVDVDPALSDLLAETFREHGLAVSCVSHPLAARWLAKREPFDVALVEAVLPDEPGPSLAEHLAGLGIAVLLMSASTAEMQRLEAEARPCLRKPFRPGEGLAAALAVLSSSSIRRIGGCSREQGPSPPLTERDR
jgi:DNA-binding response OmpR family regulator